MDTVDRIFALVSQKGIEQKEFARLVGVSDKTASAWACGRSKSYTKSLSKIAEVLGTTTDYLHTGKEPQIAPLPEDQLDAALVAELTTATPEEITQVRAFLQGLKAGRRGPASPDK